jgi:CysZ protein
LRVVPRVKHAALGFFAGVRALFGGLGFVVTTPGVWGWAMIPVVVATLLFGGATALAIWGGGELAHRIADPATTHVVWSWALKIVLWLIGIVVGFFVALTLAQPISGFALEAIARKQEVALGGRTWPDVPFTRGLLSSLRVSLTALAVSLPILAILAVITLLFPPAAIVTVPLKLIVTGLAAAYDFLDYPFSVRAVEVPLRVDFMKANFWAVLGFGLSAAALLLVPGMALLLLPFGVAGATRMVVEADRQGSANLR